MFKKKISAAFQKADFTECMEGPVNPGRGWYRIHTFVLGKEETAWREHAVLDAKETISLVIFDIGAYQNEPLEPETLILLSQILDVFSSGDREMILRVVYDREGKGMEKEPSLFSLVLQHMRQIGPVLKGYADHILLVQGLFVGSWGEMHHSKFLSAQQLKEMTRVWDEVTEKKLRLAFRRPVQYRQVFTDVSGEHPVGFYDDAIAASASHLGTFGEKPRSAAEWEEAWQGTDELAFVEELSKWVPCGGEAIAGDPEYTAEETVELLKRMHVSYLNCIHDAGILTGWKQMNYRNWPSLYTYIGLHLGYRFLVRDVNVKEGKKILVVLENTGFSHLYDAADLYLYVETEGKESRQYRAEYDLCSLLAGEKAAVSFAVGEVPLQSRCFLELMRRKDQKSIRFANVGAAERLLLGTR